MIKTILFVVAALGLLASVVRAECPLKSGDRVVFLGDSITEQRIHTRYVMNYFTLRYPGVDVTFRNAGWGGDSAPGALGRLQRDVLALKPTVVTICFGMNDGGYREFTQPGCDWFMKGMTGLVSELKKANVRVVLLGPGCVDPDQQPRLKECNYNDTLSKYSKAVKELADKEKVDYICLHDIMLEVQNKAKAKDPKYTMIPDSVHPSEPGQTVMAYAILKALGCKDQASGLEIDAAKSKATTDRCKVDDLKVAGNSVTFTRSDEALPTALDPGASTILDFVPFTRELNQYNFKVAGLKAGKWNLTVEGIDVGTFSEKDLAAGVNLATLPGPWQRLGEQVNEASRTQENDYFYAWRGLIMPNIPAPEKLKKELDPVNDALETFKKKANAVVDEDEAARLKTVPKERAWKWSLTMVADPITKGQRVFTCGHSFHVWVPDIVADLCRKAGIQGHEQIGISPIGGSQIIQHWDVADDKFKAKESLKTGKVDVLTLSPIFLPDAGIENFTKLALEHNKDIRILIQPIWLRWDIYEPTTKQPAKVDHNAATGEGLRKLHEVYFKDMDAHIRELNKKFGKTVLFEVPAAQAIIALRERIIAGKAPGLKSQEDLFTDALGHGTAPLRVLVGYCNYAVMYRRSPAGLPVPEDLKQAKLGDQEEKLNRLLQDLAWEAVIQHPLSGVRLDAQP